MIILVAVLLLTLSQPGVAQEQSHIKCTTWEGRSIEFASLENPVIAFTERVTVDGEEYAGWYLLERSLMHLLPFKAFFLVNDGVYVDGLEIGERFETPAALWEETEFIDFPSMLVAFNDLSRLAPTCTLTL